MLKRIAILTSGGDSPGMNAAARSAVRVALHEGAEVWGICDGYKGLLDDQFVKLESRTVGNILQRGGTFLGTARCAEFQTPEGRQKAADILKARGIEGLLVIGGDGSFRGANELADLGIAVVGLPGTIDNDIWGTDYTIGADTAANTAVEAINKLRDTAASHGRVIIVEVMGRNCGWIAMTAGLAGGAEQILIPEMELNLDSVCEKLQHSLALGKRYSLIVVAEGVGAAKVSQYIEQHTGIDTRVTVLGHVQRGGSPSVFDRILASTLGEKAALTILAGISRVMIGYQKGEVVSVDLNDAVANKKMIDASVFRLANILAQ